MLIRKNAGDYSPKCSDLVIGLLGGIAFSYSYIDPSSALGYLSNQVVVAATLYFGAKLAKSVCSSLGFKNPKPHKVETPIEVKLGLLIFQCLPREDRANLGQTNWAWNQAKIVFEAQAYHTLETKISDKSTVYMSDKIYPEQLIDSLGCGGSKRAIKLQNGRALLIPNMDVDPICAITRRWPRIVYEECEMSKFLTSIGLLSPLSERVSIFHNKDIDDVLIPAYVSETFENILKQKVGL